MEYSSPTKFSMAAILNFKMAAIESQGILKINLTNNFWIQHPNIISFGQKNQGWWRKTNNIALKGVFYGGHFKIQNGG